MGVKSFNSADLNNIAKKDGRYNVIENISGAKKTLNPPAVAYSVRKLTGLTGVPYDGPAMRILVDATGDGADATDLEFDINFTADGDLDVADIELKCTGGKDAYVVKWYDQSGAGNDAVQTTYSAMPQICSAGSVTLESGQPALSFDKTSQHRMNFNAPDLNSNDIGIFSVLKSNASPNTYSVGLFLGTNTGGGTSSASLAYRTWAIDYEGTTFGSSPVNTNHNLFSLYADNASNDVKGYLNGSLLGSSVPGNTDIVLQRIGRIGNIAFTEWDGTIQEILVYRNSTKSNHTDIENNINSYFNIYQSRENILPGAAAAYSLRQLSDSSRLAVRVRRDTGVGSGTDDDEADVGFDVNGEVSLDSPVSNFDPTGSSATTLGEFLADAAYDDEDSLGAPADGFVTAWYDQSVNANNATQAAPWSQPKIYDSSTGLIKENGKPALSANSDRLDFTAIDLTSDFAISHVGQYQNSDSIYGGSSGNFAAYGLTSTLRWRYSGANVNFSFTYSTGQQYLDFLNRASGSNTLHIDGSSIGTVSNSNTFNIFMLLDGSGGVMPLDGKFQEFVLWEADQSSNRTDIEGNINAHYGIENFGTPSSGLLADYPGSAAAYSVRKLADTASLAMRIIVDDTAVIGTVDASDTEYDIGFDANGDLDVARIREVCNNPSGTNYNAYVVTWYDQSGNGNHATQATYTQCPQIYDGVDVIMENGKPIIKSNDTSDGFSSIAVDMSGSTISMTSVSRSERITSILCYLIPPVNERMMLGQNGSTITDGGQADFTVSGAELFWNGSSQGTSATRGEVYTQFYQNQTLATWVGLSGVNGTAIYLSNAQSYWQMHSMQEIIFWESDQSTNRTGIETDIDSYYRIYGDPDDGLLSTPYGKGAAAAYSVRRLSNNATRAMRILVDADANGPDASDNEYDIGFDVNGELDIARIEELCDKGTGNYDAYVTTWYDQSGEGNDATQATYASMPKICNAGTVITENGKPAIDFDGVDDTMAASYGSLYSIPCTYSLVHTWPAYPGTYVQMMDGANATYRHIYRLDNNGTTATAEAGTAITFTDNLTDGQQYLSYIDFSGSGGSFVAIDGTVVTSGVTATTSIDGVTLGTTFNFAFDCAFSMQEFIMWPSDKDGAGNRNFIEANINDYFNIEGV
jgi:hypothetical protein